MALATHKNICILVVDDFPPMRRVLINLLKQLGFNNVVEAGDGLQAIEKLKQHQVGLILSDWQMPNMTGLELLRHVRADEALKTTPFIMLAAEGNRDNVIIAVQAGVNNYLAKPFNASTLKEKMMKVIGGF